MSRSRRLARAGAVTAVALVLPFGLAAAPAFADSHDAVVSVLHAIPKGFGADVVDVYAGDALLIDNFTPGDLETVTVPAGTYDLAVFADGQTPKADFAVLEALGVEVPAGVNVTVTANLIAGRIRALNVYVNDISKVAAGNARLTVRHIADAPSIDVQVGDFSNVIVKDLVNPGEAIVEVPAGTLEFTYVEFSGTHVVVTAPSDIVLEEGTNTIVYVWGAPADGYRWGDFEAGDLSLATQVIGDLDGAPGGVAAGGGSTAASILPLWAIGLMGVAALGLAGGVLRLSTSRS